MSVTVPFQSPGLAARARFLAQQFNSKGGPPRGFTRQGLRSGGANLPAGLRGAGHRRGIDPQQEQRHARLPRGQHQPAAGGQVQLAQRPPALDNQRPQRGAAQRIDRTAQQHQPIGHQPQHDLLRAQAQLSQTASLEHTPGLSGAAGAQPQHGLAGCPLPQRHSDRQGGGKAGSRRAVLRLCRIDFMQAAIGQAATKHAIERRNPAGPAPFIAWRDRRRGGRERIDSHMFLLCSVSGGDQSRIAGVAFHPLTRL